MAHGDEDRLYLLCLAMRRNHGGGGENERCDEGKTDYWSIKRRNFENHKRDTLKIHSIIIPAIQFLSQSCSIPISSFYLFINTRRSIPIDTHTSVELFEFLSSPVHRH